MDDEPELPDDDPELTALLRFEPVPRKQMRADGWSPERQRVFIGVLALTGDHRAAAMAVGLSANGAYQLRKEPGGGDFLRAWNEAVQLFRRRNAAARRRSGSAAQEHSPGPDRDDPEDRKLSEQLWDRYLLKLASERQSRLEGRIAEADYYVRQLTFIELVFDLGGCAFEMLSRLRRGGADLFHLVATPVSTALEQARRDIWREQGEADRLPPVPLGDYDDEGAYGERNYFNGPTDGDYNAWHAARDEKHRLQAVAQAAWEERGRADAAARRARLEGEDDAAGRPEAAS